MLDTSEPLTTSLQFQIGIATKRLRIVYINSWAGVKKVAAALHHAGPVLGFDLETGKKKKYLEHPQAGLDPRLSRISLIQLYDGSGTVYAIDAYEVESYDELCDLFATKRLVAHNAIFDAHHWYRMTGQQLNIDCTMIMYNLVRAAEYADMEDEEQSITEEWGEEGDGTALDFLAKYERYGASLRAVVAKILGISIAKDLQLSDWTHRPLRKDQVIYAAKDAYLTHAIGRELSKKIIQLGLADVYDLNRRAIHPVVRMITNGMCIDTTSHRQHCRDWLKQKDTLLVQVLKYFGSKTNVRSTVQISHWLEQNLPMHVQHRWSRSEKTGRLKSDTHTLQSFDHLEFVKPLLEYKKLDKMLNTYGPSLIERICPADRRLHGSFTLGYTATGRLSSRSPNLQNMPRDKHIKSVFVGGDGCCLVGADYSQIEIRIAAELSRDPVMLSKIAAGIDLHKFLVSVIKHKPIAAVTADERQLGKALHFGLLYGLGANGLVDYARWNYKVMLDPEQAAEHVCTFFETYRGYAKWQKKQRDYFKVHGTVTTRLGKVRKLKSSGAYTRSVNHPVQGSAAEVVITALIRLHAALPAKFKLINCVHDEIILEVPDTVSAVRQASDILKEQMERAYRDLFPGASLEKLIDVKAGDSWVALK